LLLLSLAFLLFPPCAVGEEATAEEEEGESEDEVEEEEDAEKEEDAEEEDDDAVADAFVGEAEGDVEVSLPPLAAINKPAN
jgi:hypothetical protein